jgi:dTDP-4-dehydrorhamnose 3,5-epimerase
MEFVETRFKDAWLIKPTVHRDGRGFFMESYSRELLRLHGIDAEFVQDNHSRSAARGVLRGLHFQVPPHAQAKLVRIVQGAAYDVIVDLRTVSPTFGAWQAFELSAENFEMLYVPGGFAHGFCTLAPATEMIYKVDDYYAPSCDAGIRWDDPDLAIPWPVGSPVLSEKDTKLPLLRDFKSPF